MTGASLTLYFSIENSNRQAGNSNWFKSIQTPTKSNGHGYDETKTASKTKKFRINGKFNFIKEISYWLVCWLPIVSSNWFISDLNPKKFEKFEFQKILQLGKFRKLRGQKNSNCCPFGQFLTLEIMVKKFWLK